MSPGGYPAWKVIRVGKDISDPDNYTMLHGILNNMINILIGFVVGILFAVFLRLFVIDRREKKGSNEVKYKPMPLTSKTKIMVREIIFRFSIQKFNRDFLLNIIANEVTLMQVMHRSHFPELCKNIEDVKFGLAIYIPTKPLSFAQRQKLVQILKEESETPIGSDYPVGYFIIDAGSSVRYTGYLLARIVVEVFNKDDVDFKLFDEGILPYHYSIENVKMN